MSKPIYACLILEKTILRIKYSDFIWAWATTQYETCLGFTELTPKNKCSCWYNISIPADVLDHLPSSQIPQLQLLIHAVGASQDLLILDINCISWYFRAQYTPHINFGSDILNKQFYMTKIPISLCCNPIHHSTKYEGLWGRI